MTEEDGPFEFISQSHKFSLNMNDEDFFTDKIDEKFSGNIRTCLGKKGSLILADTRVIHRARPHNNKSPRKSFFAQVSKLAPNQYKEMILINPSFLQKEQLEDADLMRFLGFGVASENHIYPPTNINHMPLNKEVSWQLMQWLYHQLKKIAFEALPLAIKVLIRKRIKRPVDYGAQKK